jgi:hypothetical protein
MSDSDAIPGTLGVVSAAELDVAPPIRLANLGWMLLALAAMTTVIEGGDLRAIHFLHVLAGLLWTGIDLFMGFVIGPVLRRVPLPARRAMVCRLMPKMLFLMPMLSIVTGTTGYVLAARMGFLDLPYPAFGWVLAALGIITVLTVQGLGILLPTNLLVYFEIRKPAPDTTRIGRLMRRYVKVVALQGILQIAIIAVMTRFATGI